jgi:hypothetical protein
MLRLKILSFVPWLAAFFLGMLPGLTGMAIAQSDTQPVSESKDELLITLVTFVVAPSILFLLKAWVEHSGLTTTTGWGRAAVMEERYTTQLIKDRDELAATAKAREAQISELQTLLRNNDNQVIRLKAENARFRRQLRRLGELTDDGSYDSSA